MGKSRWSAPTLLHGSGVRAQCAHTTDPCNKVTGPCFLPGHRQLRTGQWRGGIYRRFRDIRRENLRNYAVNEAKEGLRRISGEKGQSAGRKRDIAKGVAGARRKAVRAHQDADDESGYASEHHAREGQSKIARPQLAIAHLVLDRSERPDDGTEQTVEQRKDVT